MNFHFISAVAVCAMLAGCSTTIIKPYADLPAAQQAALVQQYRQACAMKGIKDNEIDKHDKMSFESYKQHRQDVRTFWN